MIGARCVGAAICDVAGTVVGGISTSGPITRANKNRLPFFSVEVCKAVREISSRLGCRLGRYVA
jgi:DNA-binding IclR family transcriptional regulator